MDPAVQRALNDKLYDKRKVGALEWVILSLPFPRPPPPLITSSPHATVDPRGAL